MLPTPFLIVDFDSHSMLKNEVLAAIDNMPNLNINDSEACKVTKTDWNYNKHEEREYWSIIEQDIHKTLLECFNLIHLDGWKYGNCWFQQYYKNDVHDWHRHPESAYSCIYYVELPDNSPRTVFRNPINLNETITPDVKEGQILIFPATLYHTSPPSETDNRKTVIAFNIV